jgi:tripartite-type tricarboxylate transporter receptor subunit TctC
MRLISTLALIATVGLAGPALAQGYPNKPVRMVVPAAAGGVSDIIARLAAEPFEKRFGQRLLVENKGGAGGIVGAELVAKAPGDGYTLCMCTSSNTSIHPWMKRDMPFDALTDLVPVAPMAVTPEILAVHAKFPAKDLKELIAYAKANPGKLNYGTPGSGTPPHLAGALFEKVAGVKMTHVPYRGAALAVADVASGSIETAIAALASYFGQYKAGTIRLLVVASDRKLRSLPEVPTAPEAGVPGFNAVVWFGVLASKGTPPDVVRTLNQFFNAMLDDPTVQKRYQEVGLEPMKQTVPEFVAYIKRDHASWGEAVKASGVKME